MIAPAARLLEQLTALGVRAERRGDKLRLEPSSAVPQALLEQLRRDKPQLLAALPDRAAPPPPCSWHGLRAAIVKRRSGWAHLELLDLELAITVHEDAIEAPIKPREWILAGDPDGEMRLVVRGEPPWPTAVYEAAALVGEIDRRHRAGEGAPAELAAQRLEALLERLREQGVEAWLAS